MAKITTVYGGIEKKLYYWDVPHHFKPSPAVGYYYLSKTASSIRKAGNVAKKLY